MMKTMTIEEMSKTIEILKAITKNDAEAMKVFEDNQLDFDKVAIDVEDAIFGLQEVFIALCKQKVNADDIFLDNVIKCKDHYYSTGYIEWGEDTFIKAIERMFDCVMGCDDLDELAEVAELVFGESFIDLFPSSEPEVETLKDYLAGELWNFIYFEDDDLHEKFMTAFADDVKGLEEMINDYTIKLCNIHQYVYGYDESQFTSLYGDNISMICHEFYENRHKTDLFKNSTFMGTIGVLDEAIEKNLFSRDTIIKLVEVLFADEFEGLTDYEVQNNDDIDQLVDKLTQLKNGGTITLTPDDSKLLNEAYNRDKEKVENERKELEVEYNSFIDDVHKFYDEIHELFAHCYSIDTPQHDLLNDIIELFNKHVEL